jgi:hypothetical protein
MHKLIVVPFLAAALLAGCHGASSVVPASGDQSAATGAAPNQLSESALAAPDEMAPDGAVPKAYRCLPSDLPSSTSASTPFENPAIAYADDCEVATAAQAVNLQKMAISLNASTGGPFSSYCTGIPISYDATTGLGWVVTAAHCVVGGGKPANTAVTTKNITTFDTTGGVNASTVYQGSPAKGLSYGGMTGLINAVYIPTQYCKVPRFNVDGCTDLAKQNGDIAVLKIETPIGKPMNVMPTVRLAPAALNIRSGAPLLALGYGINTSKSPKSNVLYYINYQYFGTNKYKVVSAQASIMNGYHPNADFYSIICRGDSGGPDLYWDGTHWNLVGAHSFGPNPCGTWGPGYNNHEDVSADVRPFTAWINRILTTDTSTLGCATIGPSYTCATRS